MQCCLPQDRIFYSEIDWFLVRARLLLLLTSVWHNPVQHQPPGNAWDGHQPEGQGGYWEGKKNTLGFSSTWNLQLLGSDLLGSDVQEIHKTPDWLEESIWNSFKSTLPIGPDGWMCPYFLPEKPSPEWLNRQQDSRRQLSKVIIDYL